MWSVSLGSIPILLLSPSCTPGWPTGTYPTTCAVVPMPVDLVWYVFIPGEFIGIVRDPDPRPTPAVGYYPRVGLPPPMQPGPWELDNGKWNLLHLDPED